MFPISDEHSGVNRPALITILIILANIYVFVFLQGMGTNETFTYAYSLVPREIVTGEDIVRSLTVVDPLTGRNAGMITLGETPVHVYLTALTSMFMHGGFGHLFGNMLFLWIFGDNLEHAMGSLRFLVFYLLCGVAAAAAQVATTMLGDGNMLIPMLGASGAISGVMGGYIVLFPHRRVNVLIGWLFTTVPAWVALGMWFAFQLFNSAGTGEGGVAYAAHIGGFIAGLLLVRAFARPEQADRNLNQYLRQRVRH